MFVEHPLIKKGSVEERDYQGNLSRIASSSSTLVVLPTGMGKTVVALRVIADVLQKKEGKVLFLAPTKPLVEQHARFLRDHLEGKRVGMMTGEIPPEERILLFLENDVIASTPQVVANDVRSERISLKNVSLIIFDEAHRGVGDYAYVPVAEEYKVFNGLVLGMTASPGANSERIKEVCKNLGIERLEIRSESDPDVASYVHDIQMDWIEVDVPKEMKKVVLILRAMFDAYTKQLVNLGVLNGKGPATTKLLLEVGRGLQERSRKGERHRNLFLAMSVQAMAVKIGHALEMAETQGVSALRSCMEKLLEESRSDGGSKASRNIAASEEFLRAYEMVKEMRFEHPKLAKVMTVVSRQVNEKPEAKIIVFTHYRDTCEMMTNRLAEIDGARVAKLVGQADRSGEKGLRQKEQVGVLEKFRKGEYNVLVATSVGEEGLDVASTDLVVFYEPVPSEIRSIQRRGRTGRKRAGRVVILVTRGTRDEAYLYSSMNKERAMKKGMVRMQRDLQKELGEEKKSEQASDAEDQGGAEEGAEKEPQKSIFDFD